LDFLDSGSREFRQTARGIIFVVGQRSQRGWIPSKVQFLPLYDFTPVGALGFHRGDFFGTVVRRWQPDAGSDCKAFLSDPPSTSPISISFLFLIVFF
jgi:hypothetical protein